MDSTAGWRHRAVYNIAYLVPLYPGQYLEVRCSRGIERLVSGRLLCVILESYNALTCRPALPWA